jgi:hypothetical protein
MPKRRNLCNHLARRFIHAPWPLVARGPALHEAREHHVSRMRRSASDREALRR